jgi:hypothetical protein
MKKELLLNELIVSVLWCTTDTLVDGLAFTLVLILVAIIGLRAIGIRSG